MVAAPPFGESVKRHPAMSAKGVAAADTESSNLHPASRADSAVLLDRNTEEEGIVVDEGYCDLADPNFGDAANR